MTGLGARPPAPHDAERPLRISSVARPRGGLGSYLLRSACSRMSALASRLPKATTLLSASSVETRLRSVPAGYVGRARQFRDRMLAGDELGVAHRDLLADARAVTVLAGAAVTARAP